MLLCTALLALSLGASDPDLQAARQAYDDGRFDVVLPKIDRALHRDLTPADWTEALELRAKTHAAFDQPKAAVADFEELLGGNPTYIPGPNVPPKLRALFEQAKRNRVASRKKAEDAPKAASEVVLVPTEPEPSVEVAGEPPAFVKSPWFWAGAGAAVVTVATVLIVSNVHHELAPGNLGWGGLH